MSDKSKTQRISGREKAQKGANGTELFTVDDTKNADFSTNPNALKARKKLAPGKRVRERHPGLDSKNYSKPQRGDRNSTADDTDNADFKLRISGRSSEKLSSLKTFIHSAFPANLPSFSLVR